MRKMTILVLAGFMAVAALAGCGDDDAEAQATTEAATTEAPATTEAAAATAPATTATTAAPPETSPPGGDEPIDPAVASGDFAISTNAFGDGDDIPVEYSCDGANDQPELLFFGTPEGTASLALTVIDPDGGDWIHWIAWNISEDSAGLLGNLPAGDLPKGIRQAENDYAQVFESGDQFPGGGTLRINGWDGPCPGPSPHQYVFTRYAHTGTIDLPTGTPGLDILAAIEAARADGSLIGEATMVGIYPAG
jgi:Raf kinase inhibitor-like YbhB/YbcL family protein